MPACAAFLVSEYSEIPKSWYQADGIVTEWCISNSNADSKRPDTAALLAKWNHAMSPLNMPLLDENNHRNPARVRLYKLIIEKAKEYQMGLDTHTISNSLMETRVSSSGREWDWDTDLV